MPQNSALQFVKKVIYLYWKGDETMKAITIKQLFASLIVAGLKEYEFRAWKTRYRGEILIHAGKSIDKEAMKKFESLKFGVSCRLHHRKGKSDRLCSRYRSNERKTSGEKPFGLFWYNGKRRLEWIWLQA